MMSFLSQIDMQVVTIILLTGVIPTFFWLFFWLREDRFKPEPIGLLTLTFIAGALCVFIVIPAEQFIKEFGAVGTTRIFFFAVVEELVKFGIAYFITFKSPHLNEPIDYAVYLITAALGFAMMENILFVMNPLLQSDISFVIHTGMLRFIGASILHAVLAALLGLVIGFVFYKKKSTRRQFLLGGLAMVIILHTFFNYFIIKYVEINLFLTLGILWFLTIVIINLFERVRNVNH